MLMPLYIRLSCALLYFMVLLLKGTKNLTIHGTMYISINATVCVCVYEYMCACVCIYHTIANGQKHINWIDAVVVV